MRSAILLMLAFGLGVYVGKPAQIIVDPQAIKDCTIIAPVAQPQVVHVVSSQQQDSTPEAQKHAAEAASDPSPADQQRREEADARVKERQAEAAGVDEDELPIENPAEWARKAVNDAAKMVAGYGMRSTKFTFTAEEYKHIDVLRTAIATANLRVKTEGPMNVGKYVYYIVIEGPDGTSDAE